MSALDEHFCTPAPPDFEVAWDTLDARFPWIGAMRGVEQDPLWHAEGDVWIHTKMVCEELAAMPAWRALDEDTRRICWLAALLHDIAKPYSTQHEDGRIRSRHHSPRGAVHARRLLFEAGLEHRAREHVCGLIRHHQLPLWALSRHDGERRVTAASMRCPMRTLALVAEADIRGRICQDRDKQLETIVLFCQYATELGTRDGARAFPSDHTRVAFFNGGRSPLVEVYDDTACTVTMMSGLPGSGKTTWRKEHRSEQPVISLDEIRAELSVHPEDDQGAVRQLADERARAWLREQRDFVWDATNLNAQRRRSLIKRFFDYKARVDIVTIETTSARLWKVQRDRGTIPRHVIQGMLERWEAPDLSEAHSLLTVEAF